MEMIAAVVERTGDGGDAELAAAADETVTAQRAAGHRLPGFGHRQHKVSDPRIDRLFAIAREVGVEGRHLARRRPSKPASSTPSADRCR